MRWPLANRCTNAGIVTVNGLPGAATRTGAISWWIELVEPSFATSWTRRNSTRSVAGDPPEAVGEFPLEAQADGIEDRLGFLHAVAKLWRLAARPDVWLTGDGANDDALASWLTAARRANDSLTLFLDRLTAVEVPEPSGGHEGMIEFDRRRAIKGHLLDLGVSACVEVRRAALALAAVRAPGPELPASGGHSHSETPTWESLLVRIVRAIGRGDAASVRDFLPSFVAHFRREPLLYCPPSDGGKPREDIIARAGTITEFLLAKGAKLIVVACNTATIAAVEHLRATYPVPFVGMEPAIKPAVAHTRSGVVGVLATGASLAGEKFHKLVARHAQDGVRMITQPCPGLVECVERGDLEGDEPRRLVTQYTQPLLTAGADTLVLGCTHYPFLRPLIAEIVGPQVALLDTGEAVARQTRRVLEREQLLNDRGSGGVEWHTSGDAAEFERLHQRLMLV